MPKINPFTVPVIVSAIKNSPTGKIVVIEGSDDVIVYRPLMHLFSNKGIKIVPAGGRTKVLEVFDEVKKLGYLDKAIFIVDQDSWIFSGIPTQYQHPRIIYTSGYSIENDIFVDKGIDNLLIGAGIFPSFNSKLQLFLQWFALAIDRFCDTGIELLDVHPDRFFSNVTGFCTLKPGESHPNPTFNDLIVNYPLKFRGKCLLPLAINELNSRPNSPNYNSKTLMEETAINGRGVHLNRIFSTVNSLA